MAKVCSNCDDCFYCRQLDYSMGRFCAYLFVTGHRRPCPPGDGCTVKVGREVYRRKVHGKRKKVRDV